MTSVGSFDNRTTLKGTEALETRDAVYHSGHRDFLVETGTKCSDSGL